MANMMQYDLVSPERLLASGEATEVHIPGAEGDLTAMADHAALITTLRPGLLKVVATDGTKEYFVSGGFAEINAAGTSVLAELALPREEVTQEIISDLMTAANVAVSEASDTAVDAASKRASDIQAAAAQLGLSA